MGILSHLGLGAKVTVQPSVETSVHEENNRAREALQLIVDGLREQQKEVTLDEIIKTGRDQGLKDSQLRDMRGLDLREIVFTETGKEALGGVIHLEGADISGGVFRPASTFNGIIYDHEATLGLKVDDSTKMHHVHLERFEEHSAFTIRTGDISFASFKDTRMASLTFGESVVARGVDISETGFNTLEVQAGADLTGLKATHARIITVKAEGATLNGANFEGATMGLGSTMAGASLMNANLKDANLVDVNLRGANMIGANIDGAKLQGADLRGAMLQGVTVGPNKEPLTMEWLHNNGAKVDSTTQVGEMSAGQQASLSQVQGSLKDIEFARYKWEERDLNKNVKQVKVVSHQNQLGRVEEVRMGQVQGQTKAQFEQTQKAAEAKAKELLAQAKGAVKMDVGLIQKQKDAFMQAQRDRAAPQAAVVRTGQTMHPTVRDPKAANAQTVAADTRHKEVPNLAPKQNKISLDI